MFTHLVLLKRSPFFIYAANEEDALNYAANFKDDLVGIAISASGLEVKQPTIAIRLTKHVTPQIELDPTKENPFYEHEDHKRNIESMVDETINEKIKDI